MATIMNHSKCVGCIIDDVKIVFTSIGCCCLNYLPTPANNNQAGLRQKHSFVLFSSQRSRTNSYRSHANTEDMDSPPEDDGDDVPSSSLASPQTSPSSSKSPRASSSPVRNSVSGIPPPSQRQDSRLSEARSHANSKASRLTRSSVVSDHDSLRDPVITAEPEEPFESRGRTASTHSSPREQHVSQDPRNRRSSVREPPRTLNGLHDESARKPSRVTHGRPLRASVSGDSRVSTPLFLPNTDGPARPKDFQRRRNGAADSERGFDSGFFWLRGKSDIPGTRIA